MSRGAMQHVELDEPGEAAAPAPAPTARPPRLWRWVVGGAAALVAGLVVTQVVLDSRERAAADRLAATPGVVRAIDQDVGVLWRPDPAATAVLLQGIDAGGAALGLSVAEDGSQAFVALDQRTGEQRFSTRLLGADPDRARSLDRSAAGTCVAVPADEGPPRQAACLVSDGFVQYGDEGVQTRKPATSTRVVVLDTADGHVVADWSAPGATTLTALPGLAVVGVPGRDGGSEVTGRDLRAGDVRWRFTPPLPGADRRAFAAEVRLFAVDGLVGVTIPGWTATVLSSSGQVIRASRPGNADHVVDPVAGRAVLLYSSGSGGLWSTLVERGRADVELTGEVLPFTVDDGSVPDLVLTSGGNVRGWDRSTGAARWKSDVVASVNALVLRGRVYLSTQAGVVALDGRTGDVVWRGATAEGNVPGFLVTDGKLLVAADQPVGGGPRSELVAYALDDGRTVWRVPLPDGLRSSVAVGHLFLGWGDDGRLVVLG
ncbi:PQQ-binding-like beta-propeller repeat protein [Cellulomonas humilata]|uniref:PQQ-binding-like beta-propeller repeat protein n=1 Tax=Cellulomonas humilata TaxID=144055 RepID=A0A7Y6DWI5_9CELL|nr:PQQ-binding-like beta-propeller repeat protein [Cellulomonas humilata]NUU16285.1 PQQ-binding-like beta-propeller repeat protein [Cellulomonas humilata]